MLFKPGQRHSYRAAESAYTDCWMHISSDTPLLFEGFPFGKPLPLRPAERFYRLFGTILDEFYANRRNGAPPPRGARTTPRAGWA